MGESLAKEEARPFAPSAFSSFVRVTRDRSIDVLLHDEWEIVVPYASFLLVAGRNARILTLGAEKFETYLREEGLDAIVADRLARGESGRVGRERYTRYLKLLVGPRSQLLAKRHFDQRLEIALESDAGAGPVQATITFDGEPLRDVAVTAFVRGAKSTNAQKQRTNLDGKVTFDRARGLWNIRLVHMRRCYGCVDAEWESFWGSFVLELK